MAAGAERTGRYYLTSGRAAELSRELAETEGRLAERLRALERRVARAEQLPLELLRRQTATMLELYKEVTTHADREDPPR